MKILSAGFLCVVILLVEAFTSQLTFASDYKKLCSEDGECLACRVVIECQSEHTFPNKCVTKDIMREYFIQAPEGCFVIPNSSTQDCYICDGWDEDLNTL